MTTRMRQFKLKAVRIRIKGWEETENHIPCLIQTEIRENNVDLILIAG